MSLAKRIIARFPGRLQNELKRIYFARKIRNSTFETDEPEYCILKDLINPGDWVIDVGANVGHYTKKFSELVGVNGRVIAFEPVPTTFSLLASNVDLFEFSNVTLINAAVSDQLNVVGMELPSFDTGLTNYYQAHLSHSTESALSVLALSVDSLCIDQRVSLVKIDAEGHESHVLAGMMKLIDDFHPVLIVETGSEEIIKLLSEKGYYMEKLNNSPNIIFRPVI